MSNVRIEGDFAYVKLTQGYEAKIDASDARMIGAYKWSCVVKDSTVYAARLHYGKTTRMHRLIMDAPKDMQVDHVDGNGLNNTRDNLRIATNSQNQHNKRKNKNNTSGFKGVGWDAPSGKWRARIMTDSNRTVLGYFDTPEAAYVAYCKASEKMHGEFGRTE